MKIMGTTGYPQVLYGLERLGYFLLNLKTEAAAAIQKTIEINMAKVIICSNDPLSTKTQDQRACMNMANPGVLKRG